VKKPPFIAGEPVLGTLRDFARDRLGFLSEMARKGDVVSFKVGWRLFHLVASPEGVQRVLVDNYPNYTKETRGQDLLRTVLGDGLVTSEGDAWRRQRRLAQPAFHKDRLATFVPIMTRSAREMLATWKDGETRDVSAELSKLTLTAVGRALMSSELADSATDVGQALTLVLREIAARTISIVDLFLGTRVPTPRNRRFNSAIASLDRVVEATIAERRRDPGQHQDLLSLLMTARDEETQLGMSDRLLRDQVITMILAGHETTSNALAWTLLLLSKHPAVARQARAEVESVLGDREPELADLGRLEYVRAVVEESMRLYPPVWTLARNVLHDDVISGYDVPGGSYVFVSPWVTHRHPDVWDNPEGFDPERFLGHSSGERARYAYFPFGGGARQCIGNTFALTEAQVILAMILQRFRLDLMPGQRIEPEPLATLRPKYGMEMRIKARKERVPLLAV
jgi:cytochrome P450